MRVAVTGGSGQLGSLMIQRLLADPSISEVVCLDVRPPTTAGARLRAVQADVRDADFARHLQGCEGLFHFAFVVTKGPPRKTFDAINVSGSQNVFRAAATAGVGRVVYSSSIAAYGLLPGHPVPVVEETPRRLQQGFPYAAAKFQVEAFLDELEPTVPRMSIARLRPAILIGHHIEHELGQSLRKGQLVELGTAPIPVVWDEDVADAALLAFKAGARGAFNLAADDPLPPKELAAAVGLDYVRLPRWVRLGAIGVLRGLQALSLSLPADPSWLENGDVPLIVSSEKARRELAWRPRYPSCVEVMKHFAEASPHQLDRRLEALFKLWRSPGRRLPEADRALEARLRVELTGTDGGEVGVILGKGRLEVVPNPPRPPTAKLTVPARKLLEILRGELAPTPEALAADLQIEGDAAPALAFLRAAACLRAELVTPGPRAFARRRLARELAESARR
jgi:nucleoside-diphosphate-sugar epimerase